MNKQGNLLKAVIFDIDGTLLDSNAAHAESFVAAFEKYDKSVAFADIICLIGMGADDILGKFLSKDEIEQFGKDLTDYRKRLFLEKYLPGIKTFPKVRELFEKLKTNGMQTALASSASEEELEKYLEKLKISDLLDRETNADDAENAKPEPDIFLAAFGKLKNVEKKNVLIIGDTPYDAEAAVKANITIYGVTSGGWSRAKLLEKGCLKIYENTQEIFDQYETIFPIEN